MAKPRTTMERIAAVEQQIDTLTDAVHVTQHSLAIIGHHLGVTHGECGWCGRSLAGLPGPVPTAEEYDRAGEAWQEGHYQPGVSDPADITEGGA